MIVSRSSWKDNLEKWRNNSSLISFQSSPNPATQSQSNCCSGGWARNPNLDLISSQNPGVNDSSGKIEPTILRRRNLTRDPLDMMALDPGVTNHMRLRSPLIFGLWYVYAILFVCVTRDAKLSMRIRLHFTFLEPRDSSTAPILFTVWWITPRCHWNGNIFSRQFIRTRFSASDYKPKPRRWRPRHTRPDLILNSPIHLATSFRISSILHPPLDQTIRLPFCYF